MSTISKRPFSKQAGALLTDLSRQKEVSKIFMGFITYIVDTTQQCDLPITENSDNSIFLNILFCTLSSTTNFNLFLGYLNFFTLIFRHP